MAAIPYIHLIRSFLFHGIRLTFSCDAHHQRRNNIRQCAPESSSNCQAQEAVKPEPNGRIEFKNKGKREIQNKPEANLIWAKIQRQAAVPRTEIRAQPPLSLCAAISAPSKLCCSA